MSPVSVRAVLVEVFPYGYGLSWTESCAALAVHAILVSAVQDVIFLIVIMSIIAALVHADFASYTVILIPFYYVLGRNVTFYNLSLLS